MSAYFNHNQNRLNANHILTPEDLKRKRFVKITGNPNHRLGPGFEANFRITPSVKMRFTKSKISY